MSLPLRGAWIEILPDSAKQVFTYRRSPCGGRGLKYVPYHVYRRVLRSLPLRGAWIEIALLPEMHQLQRVAPLAGGVD